jgi:hypothetical protein
LLSISLVAWVASAWSLSRFSMFWNCLASITNESTTFGDLLWVGQGVTGGNQSPFAFQCLGAFVLLFCTNQCLLGESVLL